MFPATPGANARGDRWRPPAKPCGKTVPSRQTPAAASADSAGVSATGYREGRPRRFGMGPAVVLGQDLAAFPGRYATVRCVSVEWQWRIPVAADGPPGQIGLAAGVQVDRPAGGG